MILLGLIKIETQLYFEMEENDLIQKQEQMSGRGPGWWLDWGIFGWIIGDLLLLSGPCVNGELSGELCIR